MVKKVAGRLRLDLSQYWEIEAFSQFGSDLDVSTLKQLERGKRLIEVLKQNQYEPLRISQQIVIIYAAVNGFLDDIDLSKVQDFEKELHSQLRSQHQQVLEQIETKKDLDDVITKQLEDIINDVRKLFVEEAVSESFTSIKRAFPVVKAVA